MTDIFSIFGTLAAFATGTVAITEFIKQIFHITVDRYKQWTSWGVSIIFAIIGLVCQLGFFVDYGTIDQWQAWVMTIITGFGVGLMANGEYKIQEINDFIKFIERLIHGDNTKTSK